MKAVASLWQTGWEVQPQVFNSSVEKEITENTRNHHLFMTVYCKYTTLPHGRFVTAFEGSSLRANIEFALVY